MTARSSWEEQLGPWVLAAGSAVAAGLADSQPTGTPVVDPLYTALFAAAVVLAASRAPRPLLLWLGAIGMGMSRGWLIIPAAAGLVVAFAGTFRTRPSPALGALGAAFTVEAVLRWPHVGFLGATALVAAAGTLPVLIGGLISLPRRVRRRVTFAIGGVLVAAGVLVVPLLIEGLLARNQMTLGTNAAEAALRSVSAGQAADATQQLAVAGADFRDVSDRLGAWWTAGARLVPVAAQQRQAVSVAASVARDVSLAAKDQSAHIDFAQLRYKAGGLDLSTVQALHEPLGHVAQVLTSGVNRLAAVDSQWLVSPVSARLGRLDREVVRAQSSATLAELAVADAPDLLGSRHYLVLFTDPDETRGLGGLIVSYGELTAENGRLSLDQFSDISQLNATLAGRAHLSGPASYLARYGSFQPQDNAQDVTYAPDLPTVTDVLSQLFAEAGQPRVDGVLLLDPKSMAALLQFTGPVEAPGMGQLTSANAADVIERGEYADYPLASQQTERRAALTQAMSTALQRLAQGSLPSPQSLADALSPSVRRGDLLFWSIHPEDRPLIDRLGIGGEFPRPGGGDLLAVVTQNAANNKIDSYLQRSVDDRVHFDRSTGQVSATLTVKLHNQAPAAGLSSEVIGSFTGSNLPTGTNLTWVTVYTPLQLVQSSVDLQTQSEFGVNAYSGFVAIGPQSSTNLVVHLQGSIRSGRPYRLTMYEQPMAMPDSVTVELGSRRVNPGGRRVEVFTAK